MTSTILRVLLRSHLIDVPQAQTVFLEEEDRRREGRVASLRMRFRKLSGERGDEGYKGNTQNVLEHFSIKKRISILTF